MPTVLLVRHAQASFGSDDYDVLSGRGIEQAEVLAADLMRRGPKISMIASGTLSRQRGTIAPLAALTGAPASVDPRWDEYHADSILQQYSHSSARLEHRSGAASGLTSPQFQAVLEDALLCWIAATEQAPPVEPWRAFYERANRALDDLVAALEPGQTALACTSGGVLAAICVRLLGAPDQSFVRFNRVTVNAGITKITHGRGGTTLVSFNEHQHLERPGTSLVTYR